MSQALVLAKRRFVRRRRARGAVMFIVAMTLAVLASLGLYALSSAATEVRTAGYERAATQAHYLTEYAAIGAAQTISYDTAQTYFNLANDVNKSDSRSGLTCAATSTCCISLPKINTANAALLPTSGTETRTACYRIGKGELSQQWPGNPASATGTPALDATNPLGQFALDGNFYVELTDTACAPMPGMSGRVGVGMLTMTTVGFVQPSGVSASTAAGDEGMELARLRILAGPITCPQLGP